MQVESLAVALRKRSNWEAIDLGFALARQWFLRLWSAWLIGAVPVFLITTALLMVVDHWFFTLSIFFFLWWLKPLYEQPLLYILSRQLFSEPVPLCYVFNNYFQIVKLQLPALLLWRRLSLSRSFNSPVAMLEGLAGKDRRSRLNVLHSHQSNSSQWLTIICFHLEAILYLSILLFVYMLIPEELIDENFLDFLDSENAAFYLIERTVYFIAISIIAPFYVAAGFSLYITRRTKLEGWDIELAFKRMQNRLSNKPVANGKINKPLLACMPLLACLFIQSFISIPAYADQLQTHAEIANEKRVVVTKELSKTTIQAVLEHEHFGKVTKEKQWVYIGFDEETPENEPPEWLEKFFKWLFKNENDKSTGLQIFEILIWLGIAALAIWLLRKYSHWMKWINTEPKPRNEAGRPALQRLMGMEITQESLPKNILETVSKLLSQKQYREALSLLYRASLAAIIHRGDIEIPASATEQECSQLVSKKRAAEEAKYFKALTRAWILLAYGDHAPSNGTLSQLRDNWTKYYGEPA